MDHKEKIEFLYQSINDTQATIRAIDIKIGFLFIVAFTPLSLSDNLISIACQLWNRNCFYNVLIFLIMTSWSISIIYLFLTLTSISNPSLNGSKRKLNDFFYGKELFIENRKNLFQISLTNRYPIQEICDKLSLDTDIVQELVLEKMKITYIREIKMHRYCRCVKFFYCWLFLGITLYIWSKIN